MGLRVVKIMVRWWVDGCVVRKSVIRRAQMARPRPLVYLLDCLVCCEGGVVVRWYGGMGMGIGAIEGWVPVCAGY